MSADEFETIRKLLVPLTRGDPAALGLTDDVAALAARPGFDLILTQDALAEGVHFLPGDPPGLVARKLLRVNLSDLAAKGAEAFGYLLTTAWSARDDWARREAFARGLAEDGEAFGVNLLGGDTIAAPGPSVFSLTMLGYVPAGRMVRRAGARAGDALLVSGPIGDGWLGLRAARGEIADPDGYLAGRYRLPAPRVDLIAAVRQEARASCDISDGLLADAGHIARASGLRVEVDLDRLPLSGPARGWLAGQADPARALAALASGGDDYQLAIAAPAPVDGFQPVGRFVEGRGVGARFHGAPVALSSLGWRHA